MSEISTAVKVTSAVVAKVIDRLLFHLFTPYSPEQLQYLIDNDVTLIDLFDEIYKEYKTGRAKEWRPESRRAFFMLLSVMQSSRGLLSRVPPSVVQQYFTVDAFLEWVKRNKEEFYEILNTKKGKAWLGRQLEQIGELFGIREYIQKGKSIE